MCYSINDIASFNRLQSVVSKLPSSLLLVAEQCTAKHNVSSNLEYAWYTKGLLTVQQISRSILIFINFIGTVFTN